jgi:nucleotide-binding universal stress UspA family protein
MAMKNIGVFVDTTPEGKNPTDYAATLAHECGAHLVGIHVVTAVRPEHRSNYYVIGEKAIRSVLAEQRAADAAATSNVRQRFEMICAEHDLTAEFRVILRGGTDEDLALSALHFDLVLIGQRELQDLGGDVSPEKPLLSSGAPILVIPNGWKSESIGMKILVGWNASREARRAVTDALPFLLGASSATILVVDSGERVDRHGEDPGADIALYLARHGVRVEVEQVSSHGSRVADVILSFAANHGVDLIVIGAYSHARFVEMVFGGVTRTLLKQSPVPVLVSR